jgi:hypothetical protein
MDFSRRNFLGQMVASIPVIGVLVQACTPKKEPVTDPCQDLSGLTEAQLSVREQMGYTEQSSMADRNCSSCSLFVKSDKSLPCGNCLAMKGPVADEGYCTVWAPLL